MTTAVLVAPATATVVVAAAKPKAVAPSTSNNASDESGPEEAFPLDGCSRSTAVDNQEDADDVDAENTNTVNANVDAATTSNAFVSATRAAAASVAHRLKRAKSTPATVEKTSASAKNKKRRRVSFESADIVEFEPTVFTTTVTSGGLPVGMSLQERSRSRRRLDSWEMEREDIRVGRQNYMEEGYLDPTEREVILCNAGCAEQSMLSVEAEVNQIIADRRESNEVDFDFLYGLVAIGEEEDDEEEEEEEEEEDEEDKEDIEEVELLSQLVEQAQRESEEDAER